MCMYMLRVLWRVGSKLINNTEKARAGTTASGFFVCALAGWKENR